MRDHKHWGGDWNLLQVTRGGRFVGCLDIFLPKKP